MAEAPDMSAMGRRPPTTRIGFFRRLSRFGRLPAARQMMVFEAVGWLAAARLALVFVPFRVLAEQFGTVATADIEPCNRFSDDELDMARAIGWSVTRAARYVPFRAVCLPQAIAAKAMLSRRHIASVMHFGVAKKVGEPMSAHAWLDAGAVEVTGYPVAQDFVEVARFL
jgi:transglutaminase superfamily protein